MAKWLRKDKHRRKQRPINTPAIPPEVLAIKRDTILENDDSYIQNVRSLNRRIWSGKVPAWKWKSIRDSIAMSALRRAHVSFRESLQLMAV